ncbi:MAG: hypothetical protein WD801_10280 [Gemmatimonadaceae bacterium]
MIKLFLVAVLLAAPPAKDRWFGADKVKHFFMSAFVHSAAFSLARAAKVDRPMAQAAGGVSALGVGVWKEWSDRRAGGRFSRADLAWDAAGALAAAALLNGTR